MPSDLAFAHVVREHAEILSLESDPPPYDRGMDVQLVRELHDDLTEKSRRDCPARVGLPRPVLVSRSEDLPAPRFEHPRSLFCAPDRSSYRVPQAEAGGSPRGESG